MKTVDGVPQFVEKDGSVVSMASVDHFIIDSY